MPVNLLLRLQYTHAFGHVPVKGGIELPESGDDIVADVVAPVGVLPVGGIFMVGDMVVCGILSDLLAAETDKGTDNVPCAGPDAGQPSDARSTAEIQEKCLHCIVLMVCGCYVAVTV